MIHAWLEVSHSKFKLSWILGEKFGSENIRVQKELGATKKLCLKKSLVQRQKNIFSRHEVMKFQFSQDLVSRKMITINAERISFA